MRLILRLAGAAVAMLCACAPSTTLPADVVVLVFNPTTRRYEPKTVQLTTPTDIVAMDGPVARVVGGAKFVANKDEWTHITTLDQLIRVVRQDDGSPVEVSYLQSDSGALVPADFHSLNIATTYYNFERAFDFTRRISGYTQKQLVSALGTPTVYYFASFTENHSDIKDNAMYMSLVQGFLILPFDELNLVPMAINTGVLGHEYGHSIFNLRVHGGDPLPQIPAEWQVALGATPGANLLSGLDEGLADVFGTGVTCSNDFRQCDPTFIGASLGDSYVALRRLDTPHCMSATLRSKIQAQHYDTGGQGGDFVNGCPPSGCAYELASVFSSALWRAASDTSVTASLDVAGGRKQLFETLWKAEGGTNGVAGLKDLIANAEDNQALFTTAAVLDTIVRAAPSDSPLRLALCSAFIDYFDLTVKDIPSCPSTAQSFGDCVR